MDHLMKVSQAPLEAVEFDKIKISEFLPALEESIANAKKNIEKIKNESNPNFKNTIEALECASEQADQVSTIYSSLYSAHCSDELAAISQEFFEKITHYSSDISLDAKLFEQVKKVWENRKNEKLDIEAARILENSYTSFTRNGALLDDEDKVKLRKIDEELSKVGLEFQENSRKATNAYTLFITNEKDLVGFPESVLEQAKETAKDKERPDAWAFTLEFPSYLPFMQYCQNRKLREEMYKASSTKATTGEFDNSKIVPRIVSLKHQRAKLLGYNNHADFVLERRMAKNSKTVMTFLADIGEKAMPAAKRDLQKLINLKQELSGDSDFQKYDAQFYTELLKKRELSFDDEMLRPYFQLEKVVEGVFTVANKLYDLNFKERSDLPVYHADVKAYEVTKGNGEYVGLFYADFFPRKEKRAGAWMTDFRSQGLMFGEVKRPFISIVCNFTKPTSTRPSLLTLDEVRTLFHEFGHALHGLLSKCRYRSIAGTNVYWDFVELPSQIFENWVSEKECLDLFATHYQTGEKIPLDLIEKIKKEGQFLEGLGTLRQLSFGYLDMAWYGEEREENIDVMMLERDVMKNYDLYPSYPGANMSCSFGHIFAGGYSAGYYSYKWAEVLDADAFAYFKEKGLFDRKTADAFRENILEKGGIEDPMVLYKRFRGKEPNSDALLKRAGLI